MTCPPSVPPDSLPELPPLTGGVFASLLFTPTMVGADGEDFPSRKDKLGSWVMKTGRIQESTGGGHGHGE